MEYLILALLLVAWFLVLKFIPKPSNTLGTYPVSKLSEYERQLAVEALKARQHKLLQRHCKTSAETRRVNSLIKDLDKVIDKLDME